MRKTLIPKQERDSPADREIPWLDLKDVAEVEISSEDDRFPIEHALDHRTNTGWKASSTGPQVIRLLFDHPVDLSKIRVRIVETFAERNQEMAIYAKLSGKDTREILRQQFTFSPGGSTEELEEFTVDLRQVEVLDLRIDPDRAHRPEDSRHHATLASLRLA